MKLGRVLNTIDWIIFSTRKDLDAFACSDIIWMYPLDGSVWVVVDDNDRATEPVSMVQ